MTLDPLSVALAWVSSSKEFRSLAVLAARSDNASTDLVCYSGAGVWLFPTYT